MSFKMFTRLFSFGSTCSNSQAAADKSADQAKPQASADDNDVEYLFTDKSGQPIPTTDDNAQNASQEEVRTPDRLCIDPRLTKRVWDMQELLENPSEAAASSPEAALERALKSHEGLVAVSNEYNIPTFNDPNFIKSLHRSTYGELDEAYGKVLTINSHEHGSPDCPAKLANGIRVFDAQRRSVEFHYLRFCHKVGVFDGPISDLLPEDVDRLFTCGFLEEEDFDFDLGRVMLALGAYKRVARLTGQAILNDTANLPPAPQWTIDPKDFKPTAKDILEFVAGFEQIRSEGPNSLFQYQCHERPQLHQVWIKTRQHFGGRFGLKTFGISDERAAAMVNTPDASYVPPGQYVKTKRYGRLRPHKPVEAERLDYRPEVKLQEPFNPVLPDIYVTDPPYQEPGQEPRSIPLYVYQKNRPRPAYTVVDGRRIINLPQRHCQFHSKLVKWPVGVPVNPPRPPLSRPMITPRRLRKPAKLRRHETTWTDWPQEKAEPKLKYLHAPAKKFSKRQRMHTAAENDFEAPPSSKRLRIDYDLPQPAEASPTGAPTTHPLFVNGDFVKPTAQKRRRDDDDAENDADSEAPTERKIKRPRMMWAGAPGEAKPRFIMNKNGTITDTTTGTKIVIGKKYTMPIVQPTPTPVLRRRDSCSRQSGHYVPSFISRIQRAA